MHRPWEGRHAPALYLLSRNIGSEPEPLDPSRPRPCHDLAKRNCSRFGLVYSPRKQKLSARHRRIYNFSCSNVLSHTLRLNHSRCKQDNRQHSGATSKPQTAFESNACPRNQVSAPPHPGLHKLLFTNCSKIISYILKITREFLCSFLNTIILFRKCGFGRTIQVISRSPVIA